MVAGRVEEQIASAAEIRRVLTVLLDELPAGQAASLAAKLVGVKKRAAYEMALEMKKSDNSPED